MLFQNNGYKKHVKIGFDYPRQKTQQKKTQNTVMKPQIIFAIKQVVGTVTIRNYYSNDLIHNT